MDQNMVPTDPEHVVWYKAIIAGLVALATGLIVRLYSRHEKENDSSVAKLDRHIKETTEKFEEQQEQLTKIDSRLETIEHSPVTIGFVDHRIKEVVDMFHSDHEGIVKDYNKRADDLMAELIRSEERTKETVAQCNQALRSEMGLMQVIMERQDEKLDKVLGIVSANRHYKRKED